MSLSREKLLEFATHDQPVPSAFLRRLKARDPELDVLWQNEIGRWALIRWQVVDKRTPGGLYVKERDWLPIATLQNQDGGYQPLDERVFQWLDRADLHGVDMAEYLRRFDELEQKAEDKNREDVRDDIEHFIRDHRLLYNRWKTDQPVIPQGKPVSSIVKKLKPEGEV